MRFVLKKVKHLINKYQTHDPYNIADHQNIRVLEKQLPDNIHGMAVKALRKKYIILNHDVPENSKSFICAHELGHHNLHPSESYRFLDENTFGLLEKDEREANEFAAYLLLNYDLILKQDSFNSMIAKTGIPGEIIKTLTFAKNNT